jgi:hypothetical protein
VNSLNAFQTESMLHPFTCGSDKCVSHTLLKAAENGWVCPTCDYTQNWAYDFMVNWDWKTLEEGMKKWKIK